jgi:hypothetical protein
MLKDVVGRQKANEIVVELEDLVETVKVIGWKEMRPWSEFFALFKIPQWQQKHLEERITTNFLHYRSNYFIICCFLFIFQIILSPIIIFTSVCITFFYIILFTFVKNNFRIGDMIVTSKIKKYVFLISSALLLVLSGSLTRIAWMLVSCIVVCGSHMLFRPRNMTSKANKVYEDMKMNGYDMKTIFSFAPNTSSGSSSSSASSSSRIGKVSSSSDYNADKPLYDSKKEMSGGGKDLEDPVIHEDDIPSTAAYSSTLSDPSNANMRNRGANTEYDYKHK